MSGSTTSGFTTRFATKGKRGWIWALVLAGMLVVESSRGKIAAPDIVNFDKVAHFAVYGLLATLVARNGFVPRFGWLVVLIVSVFGASDEWHQSFVPGRSATVTDWIADTVGAILAVTFYQHWNWYRRLLEAPLWKKKPRVENPEPMVPNPVPDDAR